MRTCVLDANAMVSYLEARPGGSRVRQLMNEAARHERLLLMSVVNWGEVFYAIWQRQGEAAARPVMESANRFPIQIVSADVNNAIAAAELKARHKLPYADCYAAALAMARKATLVTADPHFRKLGQRLPILWLSRQ